MLKLTLGSYSVFSFSTINMMTPEEVEAMNRASLVKQKGNAPTETSGGSQAPPVAGGGGEMNT